MTVRRALIWLLTALSVVLFNVPYGARTAMNAQAADDSQAAGSFAVTGPDVYVSIRRNGVIKPILAVPYTLPGDELYVELPFADPTRTQVRYHVEVANLHGPDLPQDFRHVALFSGVNSAAQSIRLRADDNAAVLIFPESGNGRDRGVNSVHDYLVRSPDAFSNIAKATISVSQTKSGFDTFLSALKGSLDSTSKKATAVSLAADLGIQDDASFESCWSAVSNAQRNCFTSLLLNQAQQGTVGLNASTAEKLLGTETGSIAQRANPNASFYLGLVISLYQLWAQSRHPAEYTGLTSTIAWTSDGRARIALDSAYTPGSYPAPLLLVSAPVPMTSPLPSPALTSNIASFCFVGQDFNIPVSGPADQAKYLRDWELGSSPAGSVVGSWSAVSADIANGAHVVGSALRSRIRNVGLYSLAIQTSWGFEKIQSNRIQIVVPGPKTYPPLTFQAGSTRTFSITTGYAPCIDSVTYLDSSGVKSPLAIVQSSSSRISSQISLPATSTGPATIELHLKDGSVQPIQVTVSSPPPTPAPSVAPAPVASALPVSSPASSPTARPT